MRSLVTGATGFIGAALARELAERGDAVTVLVRPTSNLSLLDGLPVRTIVGDLTRPETLRGCCEGMDRVFHVAGDVSHRRADRRRQWRTNVDGTANLLAEARRAGVGRFIYTSSIAAVGVPDGPVPVDETFPFNAHRYRLQYFISKHTAEQQVLAAAWEGFPAVVVNPATVFGPGDVNMNGGRIVALAARRRAFFVPSGGMCVCSVQDVVAGHLAAAARGRIGERYILGGHNLLYRELLTLAMKATGKPAPLVHAPSRLIRAARPLALVLERLPVRALYLYRDYLLLADKFLFFSSAKAERELGYSISPFLPTLEAAYRWYRDHGLLD